MNDRLQGLDSLRGIAALLVLLQHLLSFLGLNGQAWASSIVETIDLGKFGVSLFFLISGFVIPFSLSRGIVAFATSRAVRLLPALWLSILFALALGAESKSAMQLFANAFMIQHAMSEPHIQPPYWTLCWELYFYVLVAALYAMGWVRNARALAIIAIVLACVAVPLPKVTYLIFMLIGTLLRLVLLEKDENAKLWLFAAIVSVVGSALVWMIVGRSPPETFAGIALALPVFWLCWDRFSHAFLLWLGAISYSLYLFHYPILAALSKMFVNPMAFIAIGLGLPLIVAGFTYRWVERPAMQWGRSFNLRRSELSVALAQSSDR